MSFSPSGDRGDGATAEPQVPELESPAGEFALTDDFIRLVEDALESEGTEEDRGTAIRALAGDLYPADQADLLEALASDRRAQLLALLGGEFEAETLAYLDPIVREEVIEDLGLDRLALLLSELESDDALELFVDLDEEAQRRILSGLPAAYRRALLEGLTFEENTAGRLMQREVAAIPSAWTVGETIDYMRAADHLPDDFYDLYIVDPRHKPVGVAPLSRVLRARRPLPITEVMDEERMMPIGVDKPDGEVADLFRRYGLVSAPVVDAGGRLIGSITVDDVVDVIDEEAEDTLLKLGGVSRPDFYEDVVDTARARMPWLFVNLATAVLASLVIGLFEDALSRVVALAVLLPIVASMGGNAGTQTLTIAVRALAMHDLTGANATRMIGKEVIVGLANGLVFAVVTGVIAWVWFNMPEIGLVIGAAMVVNMAAAAFSGILIPLILERLKVDPAIASTVFLTTVTDVVGFFSFLGLASLILL
ncbi:MAG: magnesium transporter [Rhodospirillales bacterium]